MCLFVCVLSLLCVVGFVVSFVFLLLGLLFGCFSCCVCGVVFFACSCCWLCSLLLFLLLCASVFVYLGIYVLFPFNSAGLLFVWLFVCLLLLLWFGLCFEWRLFVVLVCHFCLIVCFCFVFVCVCVACLFVVLCVFVVLYK